MVSKEIQKIQSLLEFKGKSVSEQRINFVMDTWNKLDKSLRIQLIKDPEIPDMFRMPLSDANKSWIKLSFDSKSTLIDVLG